VFPSRFVTQTPPANSVITCGLKPVGIVASTRSDRGSMRVTLLPRNADTHTLPAA
jgi:hypothetical protein